MHEEAVSSQSQITAPRQGGTRVWDVVEIMTKASMVRYLVGKSASKQRVSGRL